MKILPRLKRKDSIRRLISPDKNCGKSKGSSRPQIIRFLPPTIFFVNFFAPRSDGSAEEIGEMQTKKKMRDFKSDSV
jgi:hypothetical protein